jgi:hypothetical protein
MLLASSETSAPLARLEADGLLRAEGDRYRTTRRWQAAMARAALRLLRAGEPSGDLRVPVVSALVELYGDEYADGELARLAEVMTPIEATELGGDRPSPVGTAG